MYVIGSFTDDDFEYYSKRAYIQICMCLCDRVVVKVFDSKVNVIYNCRIVGDSVGHMFGSGSRSGC